MQAHRLVRRVPVHPVLDLGVVAVYRVQELHLVGTVAPACGRCRSRRSRTCSRCAFHFSKAVSCLFLACRSEGRTRRTISRMGWGHPPRVFDTHILAVQGTFRAVRRQITQFR